MAMSPSPIQFTHQISTILNADNYMLWKSQITAILRGHELISFVDGSQDPPSSIITLSDGTTSPNPKFRNWRKQDQLVLAWIFNSLSPSILAQVVNCETSRQLWTEIHQMYTSQSMARQLALKMKLQTSKKGGATCAQYLQHMQGLADQLRSIGSDLSDQELVLYTLQGLGSDFDGFVTAISLRPTSVTMTKLRSLLFSQEARQQANLNSLSSSMVNLTVQTPDMALTSFDSQPYSALYVGNRPNQQFPPGNSNYPPRGRGNSRGNYRGRGRGRSSSSPSDSIQCQIYSKWGHNALKCYHRFNITYTGAPSQPSGTIPSPVSTPSQPSPQALLAEPSHTTSSSPSQDWFLDSGTTTHITNDLNALSSNVVYYGTDMVHMGNGAGLHISHIGTSLIHTADQSLKLNNVLCVPSITKNLLSIFQLLKDNDVTVQFIDSSCFVKDKHTHLILLHGSIHDGLYILPKQPILALHAAQSSPDIWHYRLMHCSHAVLSTLSK